MAYDFAAYQADRATMEFPPLALLMPDNITLKRRRLALDGDKRDQAAIDAAAERLLAWKASGEPEPVPAKRQAAPKQPDLTVPAEMTEADAKAWQGMLAAQQARHRRRRSAYPDVRPRGKA